LTSALRHDCELWLLSRVQSIFGGTTEIQKEIIARGLGL
jgi:alkylation response protein AidB-like acyl-CoA dehydrogenase